MTLREALIDSLVWRGLFPDEARAVFTEFAEFPANREAGVNWDQPSDAWPGIALVCERVLLNWARVWIDRERPDHHARAEFFRS